MESSEQKVTKFSFAPRGAKYEFNVFTEMMGGKDPRVVLREDLASIINTINEALSKDAAAEKARTQKDVKN